MASFLGTSRSRFWALICLCLVSLHLVNGQSTIPISWTAQFTPNNITMHMHTIENITLRISGVDPAANAASGAFFRVRADNPKLLVVNTQVGSSDFNEAGEWTGNVTLDALFLGITSAFVELVAGNGETTFNRSASTLPVVIIREVRTIDHIFTGSVATLVSLLYINFGAALNLKNLRGIVLRPIGPAIGFFGQFLIMPLLSFGLGMVLFPENPEMQLGMFFTGCSPAGGASNIWTVLLGGNLDLSIAMTSLSNIASFGMMPLWLFTLGKVIFDRSEIDVPYTNILTYVIALIVPLGIGLLIQRFLPRVSRILVRILKPASSLLILFIVIFAIATNLYLFELFSWQIVVAGLMLPWLSYVLGFLAAWIFRQPYPDRLAIALETGIQNTGIAIFLLRATLPKPQDDLTTVVPVSVAIMTPLPLLMMFIYVKVKECMDKRRQGSSELHNTDDSLNEVTPDYGTISSAPENGAKNDKNN